MNALELISKDGVNVELYINGVKQEQIFDIKIHAVVNEPVKVEINRYCIK
jgi:hypothetical protein